MLDENLHRHQITGFAFLPTSASNNSLELCAGQKLNSSHINRKWISVFSKPSSISLSDSPGELWKVQALIDDEYTGISDFEIESRALQNSDFSASSVILQEKHPLAELFGSHGLEIESILNSIDELEPIHIDHLARHTASTASSAFISAWRFWLNDIPGAQSISANTLSQLQITSSKLGGSPVNQGLLAITSRFRKWALKQYPAQAFEGNKMVPTWFKTQTSLMHAAMGYGLQNDIPDYQVNALTNAWRNLRH